MTGRRCHRQALSSASAIIGIGAAARVRLALQPRQDSPTRVRRPAAGLYLAGRLTKFCDKARLLVDHIFGPRLSSGQACHEVGDDITLKAPRPRRTLPCSDPAYARG